MDAQAGLKVRWVHRSFSGWGRLLCSSSNGTQLNDDSIFVLFPGKCCDEGKSYLTEVPDSPATKAFIEIIDSKYQELLFTKKKIV